jgi:prolyl 4-hydroxylase
VSIRKCHDPLKWLDNAVSCEVWPALPEKQVFEKPGRCQLRPFLVRSSVKMETPASPLKEIRTRLRQGAAAGDVAAMAELGRSLLAEPPFAPYDGIKFTMEAAQKGHADATHLLAVFAACGAGLKQDWSAAVDYLRHAARFGSSLACEQLALLELAVDAAPVSDAAPAIARWLATPPPRMVHQAPRIGVVENFLTSAFCDWLIRRARPQLKRAETYGRGTGTASVVAARTGSSMDFPIVETDLVVALVREKIAQICNLPTQQMEHTVILHYAPGQQYFQHYDFLDEKDSGGAQDIAQRGQRVFTFLIYLNDDFTAGETGFPRLDWRYKGRKGDAVFFWNVTPDGTCDRETLHAGLPPAQGEKWLLSQWIRGPVRTV